MSTPRSTGSWRADERCGDGVAPLRVALDVTAVIAGDTGVAHYARMLHGCLEARSDVDVRAFAVGRGPQPGLPARRFRVPLRVVQRTWAVFAWPRAERLTRGADVVHSPDMVPPATRCPLVMSTHDVLPLTHPHLYGPRFVAIARRHVRAARSADVVVADCHATAAEIAEVSGIPVERIVVAPPGHRPPSPVCPPPVVAPPYLLAVGSLTPRKAFHVLARASALLGPGAPPVVVAGPDGWDAASARRLVAEVDGSRPVRLLGRVEDQHLEALYRHATLVCHPSEAEGFGIPCLEAMGYGTPVVAADIPSVREIGAGSIELVPPGDADALAEAIASLLADSGRRRRLVEDGHRRAAAYTWEAMAETLVGAYGAARS